MHANVKDSGKISLFPSILAVIVLFLIVFCGFFFAVSPAVAQTLRTNLRDEAPYLDPASFAGAVGYRLLALTYEGLTTLTPDGRLAPALAIHWESPDNGQTWRIHLRPNVRFHSGRFLTSNDVRATFEAILKARRPGVSAPLLEKLAGRAEFVAGQAKEISGFIILDPLTFELRFTEPVVTLPVYPFLIFDSGAVAAWGPDWFNAHSGGTGPFIITKWRRGQEIQFVANPSYWGPKPAIDGLLFLNVPSSDVALAMFEAGELDFITVNESAYRLVATTKSYQPALQSAERIQTRYVGMNAGLYPPFADPRVRAAVSLSIDRQSMISGLYGGLAKTPDGFGVSSFTPTLSPDAAVPPPSAIHAYDPATAKRLLTEAGYPNGQGLPPVEITSIESARDELAYVAQQLTSVLGMRVTVRALDRTSMVAAANAGKAPLFIGGWQADYPDPLTYLDSLWYSGSPFNQSRWRDADYDHLVDQARRVVNPAQRQALYQQAEHRLIDLAAAAVLPTPHNILLRNQKARTVSITSYGYLSFATHTAASTP